MNSVIKPIFVSVVTDLFVELMNYAGSRKSLYFSKSQCYKVLDLGLHGLLLSPRARFSTNGEYLCCSQCFRSLKNDKLGKNPPKFATANNFAIGILPSPLQNLLAEVTSPLLSPVRPYAYVLSYGPTNTKTIPQTLDTL
jgi:hypothetical protein